MTMLRTDFVRFNADWEVLGKRCVIADCGLLDGGGDDTPGGDADPLCAFDYYTVRFDDLGAYCRFPLGPARAGYCHDTHSANGVGSALRNRTYRCNYVGSEVYDGVREICHYRYGNLTFCDIVALNGLLAPRNPPGLLCDYSTYTPGSPQCDDPTAATPWRFSYVGQTAAVVCSDSPSLPGFGPCTQRTQVKCYIGVIVDDAVFFPFSPPPRRMEAIVRVRSVFVVTTTFLGGGNPPVEPCFWDIYRGTTIYILDNVRGELDAGLFGPLGTCTGGGQGSSLGCPSDLNAFRFLDLVTTDVTLTAGVTHGPYSECVCENLSTPDVPGWSMTLKGLHNG